MKKFICPLHHTSIPSTIETSITGHSYFVWCSRGSSSPWAAEWCQSNQHRKKFHGSSALVCSICSKFHLLNQNTQLTLFLTSLKLQHHEQLPQQDPLDSGIPDQNHSCCACKQKRYHGILFPHLQSEPAFSNPQFAITNQTRLWTCNQLQLQHSERSFDFQV